MIECPWCDSRDDRHDADGPAAYTKLVSSIYALAPDNPFDLPITYRRHSPPSWFERDGPVITFDDMPVETQIACLLRYEAAWEHLALTSEDLADA